MTVVSFNMAYRSFRGGSGRLDTHLDTPPSINRRHPNSCLALAVVVGVTKHLLPCRRRATDEGKRHETRSALRRNSQSARQRHRPRATGSWQAVRQAIAVDPSAL